MTSSFVVVVFLTTTGAHCSTMASRLHCELYIVPRAY